MKRKYRLICCFCAAAVASAALVSCDGQDGQLPVYDSAGEAANDEGAEARSEKIIKAVRDVDGVDDAAVTVNGGTAVVAVSLARDLDDKGLVELKKRVKSAASKADPKSRRVAVSSAAESFEDLKGEDAPPSAANDELFINTVPKF